MLTRTRGRDSFRSALAQQSVTSSVGGHGSGVFYPRLRRHRATVAKRDVRFWPEADAGKEMAGHLTALRSSI